MRKLLLMLFGCFILQQSFSQNCTIDVCNRSECGSVFVTYSPSGNNVFCEGGNVILENTSSTLDFDFFIVDWQDGTVDTVYDYSNVLHTYNFEGIDRCSEGPVFNQFFCYVGIKSCAEGISCNWVSSLVSVKLKPVAAFNVDGVVCIDEPTELMNASCNADTYFWDFGDGTTSTAEEVNHQYANPGTYTITLTATNDCGSETTTRTVTVIGLPEADAAFTLDPNTGCAPVRVEFDNNSVNIDSTNTSDFEWSIEPATGWSFCDSNMDSLTSWNNCINFNLAGEYEVVLTVRNICEEVEWVRIINIRERPWANLTSPPPFCLEEGLPGIGVDMNDWSNSGGDIDGYEWEVRDTMGSLVFSSDEKFPIFNFTQAGTYTVTLVVDGGSCGELTRTGTIVIQEPGDINFSGIPTTICENDTIFQLLIDPPGGRCFGPPGVNLDCTINPMILGPGTHTITYEVGVGVCQTSDDIEITILPAPEAILSVPDPACESLLYTADAELTGTYTTVTWISILESGARETFTQVSPPTINYTEAGTHAFIVELMGDCGTVADTVPIVIQANETVVIDPLPNLICSSSDTIQLSATPSGGTWSGVGVDPDGLFDPGAVTPGSTVTLTYTFGSGVCVSSESVSVEVLAAAEVIVQDDLFCEDSPAEMLTFMPSGGTWSGTGISPAGEFDPAISGVGTFDLIYNFQDQSGCLVSKTAEVVVEPLPQSELDDARSFCETPADIDLETQLNFSIAPSGGTVNWTGPGIVDAANGIFNGTAAGGMGTYTVFMTYTRNACTIVDSALITIIEPELANAGMDTLVCIDDGTLTLQATPTGGTWSGPGIDPTTGVINLSTAGGGIHNYIYLFGANTTCETQDEIEVEIIDLSSVDAGADFAICADQSVFRLMGNSPANGTWSGPGLIDPDLGLVDPALLTPDATYELIYCIENAATACEACDTRQMRIDPLPIADFEILSTTCIDVPIEIINTSVGDICSYTWDFGNGTGSSQENPQPVYDNAGTYTISLITTTCATCIDTILTQVVVTEPPTANFAKDTTRGCAVLEVNFTNQSFGSNISYAWDFGNGETSTLQNPAAIFYEQGTRDTTYFIQLDVSNECGTVSYFDSVTVFPWPIVDLGFNVDDGCSPLLIEFANLTEGNPESYLWDLGNGQTSTDSLPPDQTYTTSDTAITLYTVTLIANNKCGADTASHVITVYPPDVDAFFFADTTRGCQPLRVQFESFSTPGATISWDFGDGNGSDEENPVHIFDTAGVFTVYQFAANCGEDVDSVIIEVLPAPEVSFSTEPYVCVGEPLQFNNESMDILGSFWHFGDGDSSIIDSPEHSFALAGIYEVCLTGFSSLHNCPRTFCDFIEVVDNPSVAFSAVDTDICARESIVFINESIGATYFNWNFGDGESSEEAMPTHRYDLPGTYQVVLIGRDTLGCSSDTFVNNILVYELPISNFTTDTTSYCSRVDSICTNNFSQGAVAYEWTIGGIFSDLTQPKIILNDTGFVNVELIAINEFSCRDTTDQSIRLLATPDAILPLEAIDGCAELRVDFMNPSLYSDLYIWDFGDGNGSSDFEPTHTYREAASYLVTLIAMNSNNCPADTVLQNVEVYPVPISNFSLERDTICGLPTSLVPTNLSVGATDYEWQAGNGLSSTDTEPLIRYEEEGEYTIQLVAGNAFACRDTFSRLITVNEQAIADFSPMDVNVCQSALVPFLFEGANADFWQWDFGGDSISFVENPSVRYDSVGQYNVSLIVGNNGLCFDTLSLENVVSVLPTPQADFTWLDEGFGQVIFTNTSTGAIRYSWDFQDGNISEVESPEHEYNSNGIWEVLLEAIALNDCRDTVQLPVRPELFFGLYLPNAMSPESGEGEVKYFVPKGIGIESYQVSIYSPWGQLLWQNDELDGEEPIGFWDGYYQGKVVPQGAYAWKAEVKFINDVERVMTGTVSVLR